MVEKSCWEIKMKVIFLDIDGVLNFNGCRNKIDGVYFVNDNKIKLLKQIIDRTGAKIVLSSTWRFGWFDCDSGTDSIDAEHFTKLKEKLKEFGIELLSRTPVLAGYRGSEIKRYIEKWDGEEIEKFIILDDNADMKPYMERLIQTSFKTGLTQKNVERAVKMLNE